MQLAKCQTTSRIFFSIVMKDGVLKLFDTKNNLVLKYPLLKNMMFKTMISSTEIQCLKTVVDHKDVGCGI